jgi:hypothetical protein
MQYQGKASTRVKDQVITLWNIQVLQDQEIFEMKVLTRTLGIWRFVSLRFHLLHAPVNRSLTIHNQLAARVHVYIPLDVEIALAVQLTVDGKSSGKLHIVPTLVSAKFVIKFGTTYSTVNSPSTKTPPLVLILPPR